jgi:hypothetical protein
MIPCTLALLLLPVSDPSHSGPVCLDVARAAREHGADPAVLVAVAWGESRLRADVVSRAGAVGPLQVIRRYWCQPGESDVDCGARAHVALRERYGLRGGLCRYKRGNDAPGDCWEARAILRRARRLGHE